MFFMLGKPEAKCIDAPTKDFQAVCKYCKVKVFLDFIRQLQTLSLI